ncbi:ABC transporter permease subunit [Paenibacillus amylolyticus]|nr:ABC transporter permease subunit [Paenibacillus amylolyticus]
MPPWQGIDPSLYEAARMDGASKWRQLWHITLPGIRGVIILMLILKLSHILDAGFDQIFMFANTFNQEKIDIIGHMGIPGRVGAS